MAADLTRPERLQIMLSPEELATIDDWRFSRRMPSRAAAIRELINRGLRSEGFEVAIAGKSSSSFRIADAKVDGRPARNSTSADRGD